MTVSQKFGVILAVLYCGDGGDLADDGAATRFAIVTATAVGNTGFWFNYVAT